MKRVLIVVFSMGIGGLENILMNYYRSIDRTKLQFDFVTHKNEHTLYTEEIKRYGGRIIYTERLGKVGFIKYIRNIKKIIKDNGPYTAVHVNTEYQGGLVCIAATLAGIKRRLCHSHTTNVSTTYNRVLMPLYRLLISLSATRLLACSKAAGDFMFWRKYEVIPNAINMEPFLSTAYNKTELIVDLYNGLPSESIILGHVGRLSIEKNQLFLIDILRKLLEFRNDYYLVIVGDGNEKNKVFDYAQEKLVNEHVIFTGYQKDIDLYMKTFDVFLLPSHYEGLPVTVIEAQASGLKCLVSSSVSKEVDMGLNLVEFLPIDNIDLWVKSVKYNKSQHLNNEQIIKKFDEKNYNLKKVVKKVCDYYGA